MKRNLFENLLRLGFMTLALLVALPAQDDDPETKSVFYFQEKMGLVEGATGILAGLAKADWADGVYPDPLKSLSVLEGQVKAINLPEVRQKYEAAKKSWPERYGKEDDATLQNLKALEEGLVGWTKEVVKGILADGGKRLASQPRRVHKAVTALASLVRGSLMVKAGNGDLTALLGEVEAFMKKSAAAAAKPEGEEDKKYRELYEADSAPPVLGILGSAGDHYPMTYALVGPVKSDKLVAGSALAEVELQVDPDYLPDEVGIKIKNKTGRPLAIDWAKSTFTGFSGSPHPVLFNKYATLEQIPAVEPPSTLSVGQDAQFRLFRRDGLATLFRPRHWENDKWIEAYTEITSYHLFLGDDITWTLIHGVTPEEKAKDLETKRKNVIGKTFKVALALVQDGKTQVLELTVAVTDIKFAHEKNMLDTIGK